MSRVALFKSQHITTTTTPKRGRATMLATLRSAGESMVGCHKCRRCGIQLYGCTRRLRGWQGVIASRETCRCREMTSAQQFTIRRNRQPRRWELEKGLMNLYNSREHHLQSTEFLVAQLEAKAASWEGCDKTYGRAMLGAYRQKQQRHPKDIILFGRTSN